MHIYIYKRTVEETDNITVWRKRIANTTWNTSGNTRQRLLDRNFKPNRCPNLAASQNLRHILGTGNDILMCLTDFQLPLKDSLSKAVLVSGIAS